MDVKRVSFCIFSIYNNILLHLAEWNCRKDDPQKWTTRKAKTIICISLISYLPFYLSCIASFLNLFLKNLCLLALSEISRQDKCFVWATVKTSDKQPRVLKIMSISLNTTYSCLLAQCVLLLGLSCVFWIVLPLQLQNHNLYNLSLIPNLCKFKSLPQTLP